MQGGILFPLKSIVQPSLQGASVLLLLVPPEPPWQWDREEEKGHRAFGRSPCRGGQGMCTLLGAGRMFHKGGKRPDPPDPERLTRLRRNQTKRETAPMSTVPAFSANTPRPWWAAQAHPNPRGKQLIPYTLLCSAASSLETQSGFEGREREGKGTDRGELAGEEVPVLTQHVGDHDGRQVHVLVGIRWDQAVRREAVAQGVVSSFMVHQVQEGRVGEIGRRYGRDLVVLVVLILTVVRLKRERDILQRVTALLLQQRKTIISLRNTDSSGNGFVVIKKASPVLHARL